MNSPLGRGDRERSSSTWPTRYAGRIDRVVIGADANKATPARMYMDGADFMPTSRFVLYGYHFKSIAAARADRGSDHRGQPVGLVAGDPVADDRRQLHRLGQRLQRDHHGRPQRRELPQRDGPPTDLATNTADHVRVHLLLPADRRRLRRDHGGDPRGPTGRRVRDHRARGDGPDRRAPDLPGAGEHHPGDGRDGRP